MFHTLYSAHLALHDGSSLPGHAACGLCSQEEFITSNPAWHKELELMVKTKVNLPRLTPPDEQPHGAPSDCPEACTPLLLASLRQRASRSTAPAEVEYQPLLCGAWKSGDASRRSPLPFQVKAEIQALSSFGFQYLTQQYLPQKLREGDWI